MIGRARQLAARRAPYRALQAAYYTQHELFVHRRRAAAALSAGLRSGPLLRRAFTRKCERVFILGSGSSINAISEARLRESAAADSFGFNLWVRHPFVPSLYTVELADFEENPAGRPVAKVIAEWLDRRPEYRSVPLVFSDYAPGRRDCLNMYPRWVQESAFSLNTIPAIARDVDELGRCLSTLDRLGIFAVDSQLRRVFKYRASVTMLISLAAALDRSLRQRHRRSPLLLRGRDALPRHDELPKLPPARAPRDRVCLAHAGLRDRCDSRAHPARLATPWDSALRGAGLERASSEAASLLPSRQQRLRRKRVIR